MMHAPFVVDANVWYFDDGVASTLLHRELFTTFKESLYGATMICTNNSACVVRGVGNIVHHCKMVELKCIVSTRYF